MCGAAVVPAHTAMVGGAGVATEVSYCTVLSCARVFLHCVITCRQLRLTTSRSKRQLARVCLGVRPLERQRRRDGWTSAPRASRGAAAKTTPASWMWGPSATFPFALLVLFSALVRLPGFAPLPFLRWLPFALPFPWLAPRRPVDVVGQALTVAVGLRSRDFSCFAREPIRPCCVTVLFLVGHAPLSSRHE